MDDAMSKEEAFRLYHDRRAKGDTHEQACAYIVYILFGLLPTEG